MKRKPFLVIGLAMIGALLVLGFEAKSALHSEAHIPSVLEIKVSDMSQEERMIASAIIEAYRQLEYATLTFDTSKLSTAFVDDLRFHLPDELRREVEIAFNNAPDKVGYLTYMEAWYNNWERGANLLEETWEKAQKEGKEIGLDDLKLLEEELGFIPAFRRTDPMPPEWEDWFRFYNIDFHEDVAVCLYDDGGRLWRAFLVKKAEGWYIANRILLEIHY